MVSHELRTPLTAVLGYADILLRQRDGTLTERQQRHASGIREAAHRQLALVNDLLDVSKLEAGKVDVGLAPVDPQAVVVRAARCPAGDRHPEGRPLLTGTRRGSPCPPPCPACWPTRTACTRSWSTSSPTPSSSPPRWERRPRRQPLPGQPAPPSPSGSPTAGGIAPEHLDHIWDSFYQADSSSTPLRRHRPRPDHRQAPDRAARGARPAPRRGRGGGQLHRLDPRQAPRAERYRPRVAGCTEPRAHHGSRQRRPRLDSPAELGVPRTPGLTRPPPARRSPRTGLYLPASGTRRCNPCLRRPRPRGSPPDPGRGGSADRPGHPPDRGGRQRRGQGPARRGQRQEALAAVRGERPDLIILDLIMPVLDGFAVAQQDQGQPGATGRHPHHRPHRHGPPAGRGSRLPRRLDAYLAKPFDLVTVEVAIRTRLRPDQGGSLPRAGGQRL